MDLLYACAHESTIHGFPHLVAKATHWLEKTFWCAVIVCSIVSSYGICRSNWEKYRENATVYNLETNYLNWIFRPPAATVCSGYINYRKLDQLIRRTWSVNDSHSVIYDYYKRYLQAIANARFNNLELFREFANDSKLMSQQFHLLDVARELKALPALPSDIFINVVTEVGVCYSSTELYGLQNPYSNRSEQNVTKGMPESCYTLDVCRSVIATSDFDFSSNDVYVHLESDIVTGEDTIRYVLRGHDIVDSMLSVDQVVASDGVKELSIARRKCRLPHEGTKYFKVYTYNLCKVTCRITAALRHCHCVPFFYNVDEPVCNATGMYCLSQTHHQWYDTSGCHCLKLCEIVTYKEISSKRIEFLQLNNKLSIQIVYPRMRIKRDVLFTVSDLVVSFGGAAALFLGCSFISFVEILFYVLEYLAARTHGWVIAVTQIGKRSYT